MRCTSTKRDGEQCRADARPGREVCWVHDPELQEKASAARRRGGHHSSNVERAARRLPKTVRDVQAILLELIRDVHASDLDLSSKARSVSQLAGTYVRAYETGELQQRLEELEARLEAEQPRAKWR